jgi:nucleoside-diphosphate-sugar epimerase
VRHIISGAAGFIGSHLCERLLAEGHEIHGLDNFKTGSRRNLEPLEGYPGFTFTERDVTLPFATEQHVDQVWHLASIASPKHYFDNPLETLEVGSTGTRQMLEIARQHGARFLLTSTSECYGNPGREFLPLKETYFGNVDPVGLRSCYDESKRYAEALTMAYHRVHGVQTNVARIFNTYGPRMAIDDGRVVPALVCQVLRGDPMTVHADGSQTRTFCYINDLIEGLVRLASSEDPFPINLGGTQQITILEFADVVRRTLGKPDHPIVSITGNAADPERREPDITRAKELLGNWQPSTTLQEGLRKTAAYFSRFVLSR